VGLDLSWRNKNEKSKVFKQAGQVSNEEYASNISIVCMREYLFGRTDNKY
jgi:hypothetical protein